MPGRNNKNTNEHFHILMDNLRVMRRSKKIAVQEVADYLSVHGVYNDTKTIYGWENGVGTPSFDAILLLCRLYGAEDLFFLAGLSREEEEEADGNRNAMWLSDEEKALIEGYRSRPWMQESARRLLVEKIDQ